MDAGCQRRNGHQEALQQHVKDACAVDDAASLVHSAKPRLPLPTTPQGVKSTPTFRFYRNGSYVGFVTGAKPAKVIPAITEHLKDTERGKG